MRVLADQQRGFTLLEALVVLAVVALVAAIGYPELQRGYTAIEARRARGEVSAAMLMARAQALRAGRPMSLVPAPGRTGIVIGGGKTIPLSGRSRIEAVPAQIWFYPDGSSTGGQLTLITANSRTVYAVERDLGTLTETPADAARPAAMPNG